VFSVLSSPKAPGRAEEVKVVAEGLTMAGEGLP
jgi:hypothetical protein